MSRLMPHIAAIGELLWDEYPEQKFLGGSPAHVIWHCSHLNCQAAVAGRVGADAAGDELVSLMQSMGLSTRSVQRDSERPTGSVQVRVSKNGQPDYQCTRDVAFDHLTFDRSLEELASSADAVYFTTLGQRHPKASATIGRFLDAAGKALKVYDLNLTGFNVAATDTNGCGDAFSAMMTVKLLSGASLADIADQSCRLAAWVATRPGAAPEWSAADLAAIAPRSDVNELW